jgi:hypothetical protein
MMTHTDCTYDTKEQARQAMHRFEKGLIDDDKHQIGNKDGLSHMVWVKTTQDKSDPGHKGKKRTEYITELDNGKWMIRAEN